MIGGVTAASMQALLGNGPLRAETQIGAMPLGPSGPLPAMATVVASVRPRLPSGTLAAVPLNQYPVAPSPMAYPASSSAPPPLAGGSSGSGARGAVLGVLGALGLVAFGTAIFVFVVQPTLQPPRSIGDGRAMAVAPSPVALPQSRVAGASSATDGLIAACLRDSTQVIITDTRDQLLLDALKAYDAGHRERAHTLLKEYTHEACDRATLELLLALDLQVAHRTQER